MAAAELDPRIRAGMASQLAVREQSLLGGHKRVGWKLAFTAREARQELGVDGPLVGSLTSATLLPSGATCSVSGWTGARIEAEIALRVGMDVPPLADLDQAESSIEGFAPAFEVVDIDQPLGNVADLLASNLFHRYVILGDFEPLPGGEAVADLFARMHRDGIEISRDGEPVTDRLQLARCIAYVAGVLGQVGDRLQAGDVVITGAMFPAVAVASGDRLSFELAPAGGIEVRFV